MYYQTDAMQTIHMHSSMRTQIALFFAIQLRYSEFIPPTMSTISTGSIEKPVSNSECLILRQFRIISAVVVLIVILAAVIHSSDRHTTQTKQHGPEIQGLCTTLHLPSSGGLDSTRRCVCFTFRFLFRPKPPSIQPHPSQDEITSLPRRPGGP